MAKDQYSRWKAILIPAIVAQSVTIAGGLATGREVMEYAGQYGAYGSIVIAVFAVGMITMSVIIYEFARIFKTYDYGSFMQRLIGKGWILFEFVYVIIALVILAAVASAAGSISADILGVPSFLAVTALLAVSGVVMYRGREAIERFKTVGSALLYVGYIVVAIVSLSYAPGNVTAVFTSMNTSAVDASLTDAVVSGLVYTGLLLTIFPPVLHTLDYQQTRSEAVLSGVVTGVMVVVPFLLVYISMMAFYPSSEIVGAEVPLFNMLQEASGFYIIVGYSLLIGWTLIESAVGHSYAVMDRVDKNIKEINIGSLEKIDGISQQQKGALGLGFLLTALLLSRVGIITLVGTYYRILAYMLIALFGLPLLTVGIYNIVNTDPKKQPVPTSD
ncbi:hypothetical protein [Haloterrigena salinisoli]|uniref:hypothetical protein n=1 Tax=Haloterrigena salinisoli TaxID=3132747 RepID=UPI0030D4150E